MYLRASIWNLSVEPPSLTFNVRAIRWRAGIRLCRSASIREATVAARVSTLRFKAMCSRLSRFHQIEMDKAIRSTESSTGSQRMSKKIRRVASRLIGPGIDSHRVREETRPMTLTFVK